MFTEALFTIAKTRKQPKYPSTNEWIKKMWYINIFNGMLFSGKKEQNRVICRGVDGPRVCIQSEVSQKEKNKYRILMHICEI